MKNLTKTIEINAPLKEVFEGLTDPVLIKKWSGRPVRMEAKEGGKFSLWDGDIYGKNISVSNNQIVQDWFSGSWQEPSRVVFNLTEKAGITQLELIHENIPDEAFEGIKRGWDKYYLGPLKQLLEL